MSAHRQNYVPAPAAPAWPGAVLRVAVVLGQVAAVVAGFALAFCVLVLAMVL